MRKVGEQEVEETKGMHEEGDEGEYIQQAREVAC